MRKVLFCVLICVLSLPCVAGAMTWVSFESQELTPGRWQNTYTVANVNLSQEGVPASIKAFTFWFDPGLYANLAVTTIIPLSNAWDEIVWQPEPVLPDDGAYDALAEITNPGITAGQQVKGFSAAFDWLGTGTPGPQYYEIVNAETFKTIDSGMTIPEPVTILFLGLGGFFTIVRKS